MCAWLKSKCKMGGKNRSILYVIKTQLTNSSKLILLIWNVSLRCRNVLRCRNCLLILDRLELSTQSRTGSRTPFTAVCNKLSADGEFLSERPLSTCPTLAIRKKALRAQWWWSSGRRLSVSACCWPSYSVKCLLWQPKQTPTSTPQFTRFMFPNRRPNLCFNRRCLAARELLVC